MKIVKLWLSICLSYYKIREIIKEGVCPMKKIVSLLLACVMLCGLCACGKANSQPTPKPLEPYVEEEEEPAADTVRVTLREGLTIPEMAAVLEEKGVCSAADFITAVSPARRSPRRPIIPSPTVHCTRKMLRTSISQAETSV